MDQAIYYFDFATKTHFRPGNLKLFLINLFATIFQSQRSKKV